MTTSDEEIIARAVVLLQFDDKGRVSNYEQVKYVIEASYDISPIKADFVMAQAVSQRRKQDGAQ